MESVNAYLVAPGEECWCYECGGEAAVLAGPDHPPCDGNANYFCLHCLSPKAIVLDRRNGYKPVAPADGSAAIQKGE